MFKTIGKGGTLEDVDQAVKWFQDYGIEVVGFFIIGLPYTTLYLDNISFKFSIAHCLIFRRKNG